MKTIQKSITDETTGVIAQGVNCQRAMGSGVALAILKTWPIVYDRYMARPGGKDMLGEADFIRIDDNLFVANCYTQEFYGSDGKRYADIDAVAKSLRDCFLFCQATSLELKLPKIACGLAGLDWDTEVLPVITALEAEYPDVVVTLFVI